MSLPPAERRILVKIEGRLRDADPQLSSRFVIFGRLTRDEAMPWLEQIAPRPIADRLVPVMRVAQRVSRRPAARVRALLLLPAAMAAMLCALAITVGFPGGHRGVPSHRAGFARELIVKRTSCRFGSFGRVPAFGC